MVFDFKSLLAHKTSSSTLRRSHTSNSSKLAGVPVSHDCHNPHFDSTSHNINYDTPSTRSMTLEDLDILKLLGRGGSGSVYLAKDNVSGKHFALKVIKKEGRSVGALDGIVYEQRVQSMISGSPHFVSLEASWHDENNFYLAMPHYGGGDLAYEIMRCRTFDKERTRFYAAEVVIALEKLHKMNIVHRDIKPGNIVFDDEGHLAVADFGLAKILGPTEGDDVDVSRTVNYQDHSRHIFNPIKPTRYTANEVCGTPLYMSPEMHYGEDYSFDVDYWALGVMVYRMLTGRMPFGHDAMDRDNMAAMIADEELLFTENDNVDAVTRDLLQKLLAKYSQDRLDVEAIKAHPYFDEIDWEKIAARKAGTPWKPYVFPVPKNPRTELGFTKGRVYNETNDPFPTYNSFRAEFFSKVYDPQDNSASTRRSGAGTRSVRGFLGVSGISKRSGSSCRSSLRNVVSSQNTAPREQGAPASRSRTVSSKFRRPFSSRNKKPAKDDRVRRTVKSETGLLRDAKQWVKKLCVPKAKARVGARVNLLV